MTEKTVFIDTGAWFSLADKSDKHHKEAVEVYPELLKKYKSITTTNLVIAETYFLIRRNISYKAAITFLDSIASSPRINKIYSDIEFEQSAEQILRQYQDQEFSYTDAVSFAVMKKMKLTLAFAFDRHFKTAGFETLP
jgi:predicted nucleic acid-binding protein